MAFPHSKHYMYTHVYNVNILRTVFKTKYTNIVQFVLYDKSRHRLVRQKYSQFNLKRFTLLNFKQLPFIHSF